jgi:hypothetical protein
LTKLTYNLNLRLPLQLVESRWWHLAPSGFLCHTGSEQLTCSATLPDGHPAASTLLSVHQHGPNVAAAAVPIAGQRPAAPALRCCSLHVTTQGQKSGDHQRRRGGREEEEDFRGIEVNGIWYFLSLSLYPSRTSTALYTQPATQNSAQYGPREYHITAHSIPAQSSVSPASPFLTLHW